MKTYFTISDIHSFYDPMKEALDKAGYNKDNPDHILIVVGDCFDRGNQSREVYSFLRSIPEERLVLIKGNHEELLKEIVNRFEQSKELRKNNSGYDDYYNDYGYFSDADISNGTLKTIIHMTNFDKFKKDDKLSYLGVIAYNPELQERMLKKLVKTDFYKWLCSNKWKDYFEIGKYIFTHCFIPLKNKSELSMYGLYGNYKGNLKYFKDWREKATEKEWDEARWGCPWQLFKQGFFKEKNKVLVCGHWHTSDFFNNLTQEEHELKDNPLFIGENLIGLDACTALSHRCNVFKIEEAELNE